MNGVYSLLPLLPEANVVSYFPAELGEGLLLEVALGEGMTCLHLSDGGQGRRG